MRAGLDVMLRLTLAAGLITFAAALAPFARAHQTSGAAAVPAGDGSARDDSVGAKLGEFALRLLGVPYKHGGSDPREGLDCSGLVGYVFARVTDIGLPRTARAMSRMGEHVPRARLREGDLVFFHTLRERVSHVGIYLGAGRFIHAPERGSEVQVSDLHDPYWRRRYSGARRVVPDGPR